jgi:UDP-GlcNAc:undecaprenyl-phosphate GlcNAc-1-phosphate transferase
MRTFLLAFSIALSLSLVITPSMGRLGRRFGAVDHPDERKMHVKPVPRVGGAGIFLAFFLCLSFIAIFDVQLLGQLNLDREHLCFLAGGFLCFGIGLIDDFRRLSHRIKFLFQVLGASVAFAGGIRITFLFQDLSVAAGFFLPFIMSYCVTVFWFLLFMNAVNLIDGLDGLAAGICIFASVVLSVFSLVKGEYAIAVLFTILAGSILGFLRYNFNPAKIFLGDGGSYFLGYMISGLSIIGSSKTGLVAAILIPLLAMGVPVFDTILSPVRRFIVGKELFKPDKGHIHHRLIEKGFTAKNAVMIIYGISALLCIFSIILMNLRDIRIGLFLAVLGTLAVAFTRKLGYFEYLAADKVYGWFRDLQDVTGISHDRRTFLGLQMDINDSGSLDAMWQNVCRALEGLQFVRAELALGTRIREIERSRDPHNNLDRRLKARESSEPWKGGITVSQMQYGGGVRLRWVRGHYRRQEDIVKRSLLKIDLPLFNRENRCIGNMVIMKDIRVEPITPYTLRRVEQLRRSMANALERLTAVSGNELIDVREQAEI